MSLLSGQYIDGRIIISNTGQTCIRVRVKYGEVSENGQVIKSQSCSWPPKSVGSAMIAMDCKKISV